MFDQAYPTKVEPGSARPPRFRQTVGLLQVCLSCAPVHMCGKISTVLILRRPGTDDVDRMLTEAITERERKDSIIFGALVDDDGTVIRTRQGDRVVRELHIIGENRAPNKSILGECPQIQIEPEIPMTSLILVRKKGLLEQCLCIGRNLEVTEVPNIVGLEPCESDGDWN